MKKSKLNKKLDKTKSVKSMKSSKRIKCGIYMSSLMDSYDAVSFFNGLVFFAPVSLLVRTQAGVSQSMFFLLQALLSAITFLGEIPTGFLTDRIGYKRSLVLSQSLLLLARCLLFVSFLCKSPVLFAIEAVVEGLSYCFLSGTDSAYLYEVYGNEAYLSKTAHASNCGTAGFLISTLSYVIIYQCGIEGLLLSTMAAGTAAVLFSATLKAEPSKNKQTYYAKENETENETENEPENKNSAKKETCAFNIEETAKQDNEKTTKQGEHSIKQLLSVMKHPKAFLFASALSIFQVSWLLINFFYVEKLGECEISPEWMSAVILGYSAVEMLAEPIIRKLGTSFSKKWARRFGILCGVGFLAFGFASKRTLILPLMLILPLLLKLPEYFVMEQENVLVDLLGVKTQRAAALSILNMGVSIIEILALFASAALTAVGIGWCFLGVGVLLIICMLCIFGIDNQ